MFSPNISALSQSSEESFFVSLGKWGIFAFVINILTNEQKMKYPTSLQELYAPEYSHCFGCGQIHPTGLHIRSYLMDSGMEAVCHITPPDYYTGGVPHNLYGGAMAMFFDCHGTGSAAGFYMVHHGIEVSPDKIERFVTAHLEVDYLRPTPMQQELKIIATPTEIGARKVVMQMEMWAGEVKTATAMMVAVRIPS